MFPKHFVSKNQLPGFYIIGTLVENGFKQVVNAQQKTPQNKIGSNTARDI